ncbi:restriction endonuclease subunit S [Neptuniibacter sp. 1_MG-2023]|uniref:restriction endonuclease subunit S n=1 Tax=Neptuniibacter sp. 1_MG-2023 TaxID=3062662 RepID=UPI0026E3CEB6|nr:restriction endonuclease subunit S [Neptuniibacter sp. 1_MG-2023]MDO6594576.1 restriction endonuclease subunit S [Neptuniibacter sp. 1_MG-2023]
MSGVAEMSPKYLMEGALSAIPVGYKQSELGIIPEDWETKPLGELAEIYSGDSPSKFVFSTEGTPYFKVEQLNNGSVYADTTPYFIQSSKKVLAGSVIFPKRGASILSNKIRVLKHDSFMDTNLMALTCHHGLDELFLYNQLTYRGLDSVADTTSIPQINNKHISPYLVPLPRKAEQTAIANTLSDVDALISELEKLIAKKQAIKTATMQQLLTGRTRLSQFALLEDGTKKEYKQSELGEIPEDWEVISIGEALLAKSLVDQMDGNHGELYPKSHEFSSFGVPYIGATDFYSGKIDYKNCKYLPIQRANKFKKGIAKNGDVLFAHNATVGPVTLVETELDFIVISTTATYYRCNKDEIDNVYLASYFKSERFIKQFSSVMSQSTRNQVPILAQRKFLLVLPPVQEQTAIATILSDIDAEIQALEQRLVKTGQIKQGMMQELLTGKTRLIKPSKEVIHE